MKKLGILGVFLISIALCLSIVSAEETTAPVANGPCITDTLDIGNTASETRHNLKGWGPIEPAANGGNWGGLASMDDSNARVVWYQTNTVAGKKTKDKPYATFTLNGCNCHGHSKCEACMGCSNANSKGIVINVLDGIADDSFDVYVNGKKYYHYDSDPSTAEVWKEIDINLAKLRSPSYNVKIVSTGDAWSGFDTYGQLAISKVWSYC